MTVHLYSKQVSDGLDLDENAPTEEQIEELEEKLEAAQSDQKNLFLIIFQVFNIQYIQIEFLP